MLTFVLSKRPFLTPLKHTRYPVAMTLCIAAHAHEAGARRIVLCSDTQIGDDYSTSQTTFKHVLDFSYGLVALWAGPLDHAEDLLDTYKRRLVNRLTLETYKEELAVGFMEFRESLMRRGEKRTGTELLVAGFVNGKPKVIHVGQTGRVSTHPFFPVSESGPTARM